MKPARRVTTVAALLLTFIVIVGCDAPAKGSRSVTLGYSALRISMPLFVAMERNAFERAGIRVTLRRYETAQPMIDDLVAGRLDAAGYAAFPIVAAAVARDRVATPSTASVLVEDAQHPISMLLVRADSAIDSIGALRGRRIGVLPTVAYRRWLELVLTANRLGPDDVVVVPLAPPLQHQALAEGGVDALFTNDPMAAVAIGRGTARALTTDALVPRALGEPLFFGGFFVGERLARNRPQLASSLASVVDDAIVALQRDPALGRRAMRARLRPDERPFADRLLVGNYLTSTKVDSRALRAQLDRAAALGVAPGVPGLGDRRVRARP